MPYVSGHIRAQNNGSVHPPPPLRRLCLPVLRVQQLTRAFFFALELRGLSLTALGNPDCLLNVN